MANRLKMDKIQAIHILRESGWSHRRIARELGIDRGTVAEHVQGSSKPAKAPTGSRDSKPAKAPTGSRSACAAYREQILSKLEQGLSAQRIYQDLVSELGFTGRYWSVRRYVRSLRGKQELPFRRIEKLPGEEAQVDFGSGARVLQDNGRYKRPHVLRIVLSYSRKGYSEAVYRQTTENFIRCLENAFWYFGGTPQTLVIDNLRAAVTKADWFDPELNPKIEAFCRHYGIVILPTKPYTPRHKGKVERGIGYVQSNALKGRTFDNLQAQNQHLLEWEESIADTRIHGTTREQVGKRFRDVEHGKLQALPKDRFPFFHEGQRAVHRDGHVEVDKSYYSVPAEYVTRHVWVRWDSRLVRVFNHRMEQIAIHAKQDPGRFSTRPQDIASQKISAVERGAEWLLRKAQLIGPHTSRWAAGVIDTRGVEGVRVLQGLICLAGKHSHSSIEQACETAASYSVYRLRAIRQLIKHQAPKQPPLELTERHPLIRELNDYEQIVRCAFEKKYGHAQC